MRWICSLLFSCLLSSSLVGQTLLHKKIAQRTDLFQNNAWQGKDSFIYSYSTNGQESFRLALNGASNNNWNNFYRSTQQFDAQENLISTIRENWLNGAWVNSTKYTYTYDANNDKVETLYQTWNAGSNSWQNTGKNSFSYNAQHNEILYNGFSWVNGVWEPTSKRNSSYYGDTLVKRTESFTWFNNAWEGVERFDYTYIQQYITSSIRSTNFNNNWVPQTKIDHLVNTAFNPALVESTTYFDFDTTSTTWKLKSRIDYSFTGSDLIQELYQDYINGSWRDIKRIQYNYNASQLRDTKTEELFNSSNSTWTNSKKESYTYNAQALTEKQTNFLWSNAAWLNDLEYNFSYDSYDSLVYRLTNKYVNNNFSPQQQDFYYYDNISVGMDRLEKINTLSLFPNPCTDKFSYHVPSEFLNQLVQEEIVSMDGKKIWSRAGMNTEANQHVNISALAMGQYLFRVKTEKGIWHSFIIKN